MNYGKKVTVNDTPINVYTEGKRKPACPCCFFISDMKGFTKNTTWRKEGIRYAEACGAEYHLTDAGHMLYSAIPQEIADTFIDFLKKIM